MTPSLYKLREHKANPSLDAYRWVLKQSSTTSLIITKDPKKSLIDKAHTKNTSGSENEVFFAWRAIVVAIATEFQYQQQRV